jgi:hypothetical protein
MKTLRALISAILLLTPCAAALAGPQPLADNELAAVRGADGINLAIDLHLNLPPADSSNTSDLTLTKSKLTIGQTVDGRTAYLVFNNVSGRIQMMSLGLSANTADDGTNYVAIGLPSAVRFTNVGVDSISVQSDASAPVTSSLGRVTLNGDLSMQGQLRLWSH